MGLESLRAGEKGTKQQQQQQQQQRLMAAVEQLALRRSRRRAFLATQRHGTGPQLLLTPPPTKDYPQHNSTRETPPPSLTSSLSSSPSAERRERQAFLLPPTPQVKALTASDANLEPQYVILATKRRQHLIKGNKSRRKKDEKLRKKDGVENRDEENSGNRSVATEDESSFSISDGATGSGSREADYNFHLYQQRCSENPRPASKEVELSIDRKNKFRRRTLDKRKIGLAIGAFFLIALIFSAVILIVLHHDFDEDWEMHHNHNYKFNMAEERKKIARRRKPPVPRVHSEEELRALDEFLASSSFIKDVTGQNNRTKPVAGQNKLTRLVAGQNTQTRLIPGNNSSEVIFSTMRSISTAITTDRSARGS